MVVYDGNAFWDAGGFFTSVPQVATSGVNLIDTRSQINTKSLFYLESTSERQQYMLNINVFK